MITFQSGIELTKNFRENHDIIFLDISMEEMDGLEVARWLRENGSKACIVFLTGYPEYSFEGYKVDAHRYLLKNAENIKEALNECLSSALEKMQKDEKKIDLDVQGGILSIAPSKIVYSESNHGGIRSSAEERGTQGQASSELFEAESSGWQREYYERTKSERRRRMEEAKAAIRAEDMAKGVFIPVGHLTKQEPQKAPAQTTPPYDEEDFI